MDKKTMENLTFFFEKRKENFAEGFSNNFTQFFCYTVVEYDRGHLILKIVAANSMRGRCFKLR